MTTACPRAPRGKKKQHIDPCGEDRKKNKSNVSYECIHVYEMYIFRCETKTFLE